MTPIKMTDTPLKQRLLEMLLWLDDICTRHHIPYWLSSGTLLGAVRHGGFIPWDDDIDIEMLATDFPRLKQAIIDETSRPGAKYALQTSDADPQYLFPYAKLRDLHSRYEEADGLDSLLQMRGCFIDIFILAPSNSLRLHRLGCKLLGTEARMALQGHRWLHKLLSATAYPLLRAVTTPAASHTLRHVIPSYFSRHRIASDIFPLGQISFEGHLLSAPADPDAYLTRIYGDYMTLPPPEKRQTHAAVVTFLP